jgi:hypothetical protein
VTPNDRLEAVLEAIAAEARRRPSFLRSLELALDLPKVRKRTPSPKSSASPRPHRRAAAALDPFRVLRDEGADALRAQLADLTLDQLRDVVAQYRIEPYALAMKWKTPNRLVELIADTIVQRSRKGEAFRREVTEEGSVADQLDRS